MMEAEVFYDPEAKTHPRFAEVKARKATFVPNFDEKGHLLTFGEAIQPGTGEDGKPMVANEALAYWLARTQEFLVAAGLDPKRLHFRQHLKNEMAHYAADCWDAEFHSDRYGWVECVGVADRGSYDLRQHARRSGTDAVNPATGTPFRKLNAEFLRFVRPQESRFTVIDHVPSKRFFPTLKQKAKAVEWAMACQSPFQAEAAKRGVQHSAGHGEWPRRDEEWLITETVTKSEPAKAPLSVQVGNETIEVPAECYDLVTKDVTVQGRRVIPCVIEPSFGVDRILYAIWEHSHEAGEKNGEAYTRLRLSPAVAPVQVAVLPLTGKDGLPEKAKGIEWDLRAAGYLTDFDEAGSIGRRYARQDEVGTPLCITVDNETLADSAVTIRIRDTGEQERVPVSSLRQALASRLA